MNKTDELESLVTYRDGTESDQNLIFSTWLNGIYYGNAWPSHLKPTPEQQSVMKLAPFDLFGQVQKEVFLDNYRRVIRAILSRAQVRVACLSADPDVLLGYAVLSLDAHALHWVYVKPDWRKAGIAKRLTPGTVNSVTHLSRLGLQLKPRSWAFNPFLI